MESKKHPRLFFRVITARHLCSGHIKLFSMKQSATVKPFVFHYSLFAKKNQQKNMKTEKILISFYCLLFIFYSFRKAPSCRACLRHFSLQKLRWERLYEHHGEHKSQISLVQDDRENREPKE